MESLPKIDTNGGDEASSDEDFVPLDFRTAMINGKLYIQAKPMKFDEEAEPSKNTAVDPDAAATEDDYLNSLKMDPFNVDDGDVVLIDPGIDYANLFKGIDLPCVKQKLINNSLNAPSRTTAFDSMPKKQFDEDVTEVGAIKNDASFSIQ